MSLIELFLIALGLSMDAFAVSICKGLGTKNLSLRQALLAGLYFGGFQALMPLIGWLLGCRFEVLIRSVDHWIAFFLLLVIGGNMIKESRGQAEQLSDDFGFKTMLDYQVYSFHGTEILADKKTNRGVTIMCR